jgi:molecular chaperone DnaK
MEVDDEPTRVQLAPRAPLPSTPFTFPRSPITVVDDEPTRVGAPPEILAAARALFDADEFEPDTEVSAPIRPHESERPSPPSSAALVAPTPKEREEGLDESTKGARPIQSLSGFKRTMLGGVAVGAPAPVAPPVVFSATIPESRQLDTSEAQAGRPTVPLLVDVTPLSLCVETVGGFRDIIITRNTPVPCEQSRTFVTAQDNQQVVLVRVGQGEEGRFADNVVLGELELSGLRAAARGEAQFVVTFTLDTDGMLEVRASDPETGNAAKARLRFVGLPDQNEVSRMAQRHLRHTAP